MTTKEQLEEAYYSFEEELGKNHPDTVRAKTQYEFYCKGWDDCEKESTKQIEQVNQEWQENMKLQKELLLKKIYEYMKNHSWYGTGWYTYYTAMIKEI